jgi:hypothetical protein
MGSDAAWMPFSPRLAQADAEALIRDHGAEAYREGRRRERDVILPDGDRRFALLTKRPSCTPKDSSVKGAGYLDARKHWRLIAR